MEELGRIDINIRESSGAAGGGGGGAGSGSVGGGPAPRSGGGTGGAPLIAPQQQAALKSLPAISQRMQYAVTSSSAVNQMRDFLRSPSVAGYAELFKRGGDVRTMLAGMGATGARLLPIIMKAAMVAGVAIAAIGAVAAAFAMLKQASEKVMERFERIYRYSPEMTFAKAQQRIADLMRDIREAQATGAMTAGVVSARIAADDAMSRAYIEWAPLLHGMARVFEFIRWQMGAALAFWGKLFNFMGSIFRPIYDILRPIGEAILAIQEAMLNYFGIQLSRRPSANFSQANQWMLADVAAITGRRY